MTRQPKSMVPKVRFKGFTDEWEQHKLENMVHFFNGLTYKPNDIRKSGTFVIRSSNIQNGTIVSSDDVFVRNEIANSTNVKIGDIIVVVRNGSRKLIGKHAIVTVPMNNTVIGAFMTGIRTEHYNFINALLSTLKFKDELRKNMGATINQITGYMFSNMKFMFPNDQEMDRIGTFLRKLDNLITLQQRKLDQLNTLKKGLLQKMFADKKHPQPELRFKGFSGDWEHRELGEVSEKITQKNKDNLYSVTLTNSAEYGIIDQRSFFDKDISNAKNLSNYYVVHPDDFVYNPRISNEAPVGPIKRNNLDITGVMSPLYYVFRPHDINKTFLEYYFSTSKWHKFMKLNGNSGARSDRFSIKDSEFVKMPIPSPKNEEQVKIGKLLSTVATYLALQQKQIDKLNSLKKSLLQNMFI